MWVSVINSKVESNNIQLNILIRYPGGRNGLLVAMRVFTAGIAFFCNFILKPAELSNSADVWLQINYTIFHTEYFKVEISNASKKKVIKASARPKYAL